jgi:enoyl-CoA hydratase/carnithine racemase
LIVGNDSDALLHDVVGRIGVAVLNRPAVLNVIDMDLIKALTRRLEIWRKDPAIAAVFVRGTGKRAFCAGGDVRAVYAHRGNDAFMDEVSYAVMMRSLRVGDLCRSRFDHEIGSSDPQRAF